MGAGGARNRYAEASSDQRGRRQKPLALCAGRGVWGEGHLASVQAVRAVHTSREGPRLQPRCCEAAAHPRVSSWAKSKDLAAIRASSRCYGFRAPTVAGGGAGGRELSCAWTLPEGGGNREPGCRGRDPSTSLRMTH